MSDPRLGRACSTTPLLQAGSALLSAITLLASSVAADIPDVTWEDPEVVDTNVTEVPSPSGASVASDGSLWHVVYEKSGDIYHRARADSGWLPVEPLSEGPATARSPHISFQGGWIYDPNIHVVWEDDRTGHFEVWTRNWDGLKWSDDSCLSCDSVASRSPVVASSFMSSFAAWEDSADGVTSVRGASFSDGTWGEPMDVSDSPGNAGEPTVGSPTADAYNSFRIAWVDDRHGETEIYLVGFRPGYGLYDELRLTDLAGDCRRPSLHMDNCCEDVGNPMALVVFENEASGVSEIHGACYSGWIAQSEQITPDDGVESRSPNVSGFTFAGFLGPGTEFLVTWTEPDGGHSRHPLRLLHTCFGNPATDTLTILGTSMSTVGAVEGDPSAGLMALWVEEIDSVPTLLAREGALPGCFRFGLDDPPNSIVLAPEGFPSNAIRLIDECTGEAVGNQSVALVFRQGLDGELTWDPLQDHPRIYASTDGDGDVVFSVRGGGCSEVGYVELDVYDDIYPIAFWDGAKSPDVDGDCVVTNTDLEYVETRVGTDDYCADLDGSGLVDGTDRDIVAATMGDHCSHIVGAPDTPRDEGRGPWLRLLPSPCRDAATIRLSLPQPATVHVRLLDAAGRLVRSLTTTEAPAGITDMVWNTRDGRGRPVASGAYFVSVSTGDRVLRRPVLVIR